MRAKVSEKQAQELPPDAIAIQELLKSMVSY